MGQDPSRPESRLAAAISYDGSNYGVGLTGAYTVKDYFLTYNYDWSWTRMDMIDGKGRSVDQGVRIGKSTNKWTAYTGWEKQEICGSRSGSATLEGGIPVHFSVRVMPVSAWTWLLGTQYRLDGDWELNLEMSFSNRKSTMFAATRRF